ncbi:MAG: hypothetical protein EZS26_001889 [Candidatus Ordinivivax streblomastigis]|uniref:Winged helix DNA-binding domain-containing protein n=1 Tax=Candidatus Ordinivivax streblomastigis TaxID=2540710 RepID=A0A5M8P0K5_9BACT|nr:MAG: hypothetical protein EZS26_001889 [Candidatus Ordinivivax streblomastigis]
MNQAQTIAQLRLASQHLSGTTSHSKLETPQEIVSWMGAIQAQDYAMAKWAIGIRLEGYSEKRIEAAFNQGEMIRTHVLRPTWHFVSPENIRWMLALSAGKIKAMSKARDRDLEITGALYSKSNQTIQKALEGMQLTREELATELQRAGIEVDASRMVHFMMRAEVEGIVCSGALKGKSHTYALLDERVAPAKPLHKEEALAKLAQIYFNSHGPASLQDFVWWSGLSVSDAKQALGNIQATLSAEIMNEQTYWKSQSANNVSVEPPVHLLPAFDEYLISYRDRQAALSQAHYRKVISSNGIFRPVIIADGQVIGLWKKPATQKNPIVFDFFDAPDAFTLNQVHEAGDRFVSFSILSSITG